LETLFWGESFFHADFFLASLCQDENHKNIFDSKLSKNYAENLLEIYEEIILLGFRKSKKLF